MNLPLMQFQFYPNGSRLHEYWRTCWLLHDADRSDILQVRMARTDSRGFCAQRYVSTGNCVGRGYPQGARQWRCQSWAFDATTLSCLYTTNQSAVKGTCQVIGPASDVPSGSAVKFVVPSVANGKVYHRHHRRNDHHCRDM